MANRLESTWHFLDLGRQHCTEDGLHTIMLVVEDNGVGDSLSPIGFDPVHILLRQGKGLDLLWSKEEDL